MQGSGLQLRTFSFIDQMQPQYAALMGTLITGNVPIAGQSQLFVEVAPGNAIYRVADVALKAADVRPGVQVVERVFGILELHGDSQGAVRTAGAAILDELNLTEGDRLKPTVISSQIISNVDPYQASLINQQRRGAMLVPGQSLLVVETSPAAYSSIAANEVEKAADISLIMVNTIGAAGRVLAAGTPSQIQGALQAIEQTFASMEGRAAPPSPGGG